MFLRFPRVRGRLLLLSAFCLLPHFGCVEAMVDLSDVEREELVPDLSDITTVDPLGCGFEDNDLAAFGHPGEVIYIAPEGGKVAIVEEHANYSALAGESGVDFHGEYSLLIRSNDAGDPGTMAVVRTLPFVPQNRLFIMDQLSEVGSDGIALWLRVLTPDWEFIEERALEVHTGGYVPGLEEGQAPIEGFPELTEDSVRPGVFTRQYLDTSVWHEAGSEIVLEFRQHTLVEHNGFFTLLDNLCDGIPEDP